MPCTLTQYTDNHFLFLRHEGFFYMTSNEDINRYIKLEITPKIGDRIGLKHEIISKNPIGAGPGHCPFEDRHAFTSEKLGPKEFRVVTYNLLADLYADSEFSRTVLHPQCPAYALDIAYRKSLFIKVSTPGTKLKSRCCFMTENCHFQRTITQCKNTAMPLSIRYNYSRHHFL